MKKIYISFLINLCFLIAIPICGMEIVNVEPDTIEQAYFKDVPEKYKDTFRVNLDKYRNASESDRANYRSVLHFMALVPKEMENKYNGLSVDFGGSDGYVRLLKRSCNNFCMGTTHSSGKTSLSLRDESYKNASDKSDILKKMVQDYKIHLMPKGPMYEEFQVLLALIDEDDNLKKAIHSFKLSADVDDEQLQKDANDGKEILPKIVIYCSPGKENAQLVLNKIYDKFQGNLGKEGLGITPRYNQQVTDCIFYAQGNGGDKTEDFKGFFDDNKIHYKSDVTGVHQDYVLEMPQKNSFLRRLKNILAMHYGKFTVCGLSIAAIIIYLCKSR